MLIVGALVFLFVELPLGWAVNTACLDVIKTVEFPYSGLLVTVLGIGDVGTIATTIAGFSNLISSD